MKPDKIHLTDFFFTLSLFGVFAACSFILILIGVQGYQSSAAQLEDTYSTRTALSYAAEKVRQHDTEGGVALTEINGTTALVMKDEAGGEAWLTYIYPDGEYLYELSVKEGTALSPDQGEKILKVKDFTITDKENGFLEFSASDSTGTPVNLLLHLRSETEIIRQ